VVDYSIGDAKFLVIISSLLLLICLLSAYGAYRYKVLKYKYVICGAVDILFLGHDKRIYCW